MFLFNKSKKDENQENACMICQHCKIIDGRYICKYKGEVEKFSSCRKYLYDITKKKPMGIAPQKISQLSDELKDLL